MVAARVKIPTLLGIAVTQYRREHDNMTIKKFAESAPGLGESCVSRLESGYLRKVTPEKLRIFARLLGLSLAQVEAMNGVYEEDIGAPEMNARDIANLSTFQRAMGNIPFDQIVDLVMLLRKTRKAVR